MKHIFSILFACIIFFSCKNKTPDVTPPVQPEEAAKVASVPDSLKFCKTIAGLEDTRRAVGARGKFWDVGQTIPVTFIGGTGTQINYWKQAAAVWSSVANIKFSYPTTGSGLLRIGFNPSLGSWSYVGKDNAQVTTGQTMNIGWHEGGTDDPTKFTVELHEIGHALGLLHEQQNPQNPLCWNRNNVIADLSGPPNNWNLATIEFNVLNVHNPANVITTPHDPNSIMHYSIPARWLCSGPAIPGGKVLSAADKAFIVARYPFTTTPPPTGTVTITKIKAQELYDRAKAVSTEAAQTKTAADSSAALIQRTFGL